MTSRATKCTLRRGRERRKMLVKAGKLLHIRVAISRKKMLKAAKNSRKTL